MSYVRLDIDVRQVDAGASDFLADIHARCFPHPWDAETFDAFLSNSVHRAYTAYSPRTVDMPVGFALVRTVAGEAEILSIAVLPERCGRGIASGLLYQICEILKAERVTRIFLEVGRDNKSARALYEKFGFQPVGDRKAYYQSDATGKRSDAIIMARSL